MANELTILHCFRSPVGGIFRHVRDLVDEQVFAGHRVGILCDNNTGGAFEEAYFAKLQPNLALGLHRMPISRALSPTDIIGLMKTRRLLAKIAPDIVHTHGAKGGAFGRLAASLPLGDKTPARLYCPHGGSLHYDAGSLKGRVYFALERLLARRTDGLIFVSEYERDGFVNKVGEQTAPSWLIHNGLREAEFEPVSPTRDATDFLYVGMMRDLKGVDLFLDSLKALAETMDRPLSATLVGDGPDLARYKSMAGAMKPHVQCRFHNPMPAREAFRLGKHLIVPSRAESMPYLVLEAAAARLSMRSARVGGIPEIFADRPEMMFDPDDQSAMVAAMRALLQSENSAIDTVFHGDLRQRFSTQRMAADIERAYRAASDRGNQSREL